MCVSGCPFPFVPLSLALGVAVDCSKGSTVVRWGSHCCPCLSPLSAVSEGYSEGSCCSSWLPLASRRTPVVPASFAQPVSADSCCLNLRASQAVCGDPADLHVGTSAESEPNLLFWCINQELPPCLTAGKGPALRMRALKSR